MRALCMNKLCVMKTLSKRFNATSVLLCFDSLMLQLHSCSKNGVKFLFVQSTVTSYGGQKWKEMETLPSALT